MILTTQTKNGWWPKLSPTGEWVAYGNGEVLLMSVETGAVTRLTPAGNPMPEWPCGWFSDIVLGITTQETNETRTLRLVNVLTGEVTDPKLWSRYCFQTTVNGHVFAFFHDVQLPPTQRTPGWCDHLRLDNIDLALPKTVTRPVFDGRLLSYFDQIDTYDFVVCDIVDGQPRERLRLPTTSDGRNFTMWNPKAYLSPRGEVFVVSSNGVRTPDGLDHRPPANETVGAMFWNGDQCYAVNSICYDLYNSLGLPVSNQAKVIVRPLEAVGDAATPGIVVEKFWQNDIQVAVRAGDFVLCGYNGGGTPGVPAGTNTTAVARWDEPPMRIAMPLVPPISPVVPGPVRPLHTSSIDGSALGSLRWGVDIEGDVWAYDLWVAGTPARVLFHDLRVPLDTQFKRRINDASGERYEPVVHDGAPMTTQRLQQLSGAALVCYFDANEVLTEERQADGSWQVKHPFETPREDGSLRYPHVELVQRLREEGWTPAGPTVDAYIGHQGYNHGGVIDTIWYIEEAHKIYAAAAVPSMLVRPGYCGNSGGGFPWPLREMQLINHYETDLCNKYDLIRFDVVFGLDRPQPDAAWMRTYFKNRVALTGKSPHGLPAVHGPAPTLTPAPEPQPEPTTPTTTSAPKHHINPETLGQIGAVVGIAVATPTIRHALIAFFKRVFRRKP